MKSLWMNIRKCCVNILNLIDKIMKTYKQAIKVLSEAEINSSQLAEIMLKFVAVIYDKPYDIVGNDYCDLIIDRVLKK